ncbi:hypothetical protein V5F77_16010 [Xanthobacter sp. DSM 24535]|uniref:hypothetical protein n=1 Tax=Roseixanthobacter psychrophilus TaxID=3119917 RepID=UPI003726E47C
MQRPAVVLYVSALLLACAPARADPITPAQDKAGAVMRYQRLGPNDRLATLEAFAGQKLSDSAFDNLDACTLRETTETDGGRAKLAKTVADCRTELRM